MGDGIEECPLQSFPGLEDLGLFGLFDELDPFDCQGRLGGKGIEKPALFRRFKIGLAFKFNAENAQYASGCLQWQIEEDG